MTLQVFKIKIIYLFTNTYVLYLLYTKINNK